MNEVRWYNSRLNPPLPGATSAKRAMNETRFTLFARHVLLRRVALSLLLLISLGSADSMTFGGDRYIRPWDANRFFWQYQGRPVLLVGGSDTVNLFQWNETALRKQLDRLRAAGGNYVRNSMGSHYEGDVQPFAQCADGRYDLTRWNPEYWNRFERLLRMTQERDIIVQVELWELWATYGEHWKQSPWNPVNNINYTTENTRLAIAYPRPQYRNGTSYGKPTDFFLTLPELQDDRLVLTYQKRFAEKLLQHTLPYGHVLYCITNEIHPQYPPEWGWYWARFIRQQAAGRPVFITEMYWTPDFQAAQHWASLERPEVFDFFEASQNSALHDPEAHWRNLQYARRRLASRPRPINHTKTYGADSGPSWAGNDRHAVECFWRSLIGGAASIRFHRPPAGLGLSDLAVRHLRSARLLAEVFDFFRAVPGAEHRGLFGRAPNEAYLTSVPNEQYAIYFPDGGSVELDLVEVPGSFTLRWLNIGESRWTPAQEVSGNARLELQAPAKGQWVAVLSLRK